MDRQRFQIELDSMSKYVYNVNNELSNGSVIPVDQLVGERVALCVERHQYIPAAGRGGTG